MNEYSHVVQIEGKGLGCVALKDIKKGTLIVKEKASIIVKNTNDKLVMGQQILDSFFSMTKDDQEEFLKLNYPTLSNEEKKNGRIITKEFVQANPGADQEKLIDIVAIFSANMWGFPCWTERHRKAHANRTQQVTPEEVFTVVDRSAAFLKASKFNHSCAANAKNIPMDDDSGMKSEK